MWRYVYVDELYHHGTKGMRWGIRRYQNKDGSLTPAGKKRRSLGQVVKDHRTAKKRKAALEKARETKAKNLEAEAKRKEALAKGKLSVKKMTDAELDAAIKRLDNEKKYKDKMLETSPGKRFISKMWNDAIVPGAADGGKQLVKDFLIKKGSKALGLEDKKVKSTYEKMKEEHDMSNWKRKMVENADYHVKREERLKREAEDRAKAEAKKQVDAYNAQREKEYQDNRTKTEGQYHMKGDGSGKSSDSSSSRAESSSEAVKRITGDTLDPGTSVDSIRSNGGNKKAVETGEAYIHDISGEYLRTTSYREEK